MNDGIEQCAGLVHKLVMVLAVKLDRTLPRAQDDPRCAGAPRTALQLLEQEATDASAGVALFDRHITNLRFFRRIEMQSPNAEEFVPHPGAEANCLSFVFVQAA